MSDSKPCIFHWAAPVLAVGLIVAIATLDKLHLDPAEAAPFHAKAAAAIHAMPKAVGDWRVEHEYAMDDDAVKLLQVNAYLHRTYRNTLTGQSVELLLVQCRDARAMQGHFPPVCYPSNGCKLTPLGEAQQWHVREMTVPGMEYEIIKPNRERFVVRDFFVLPNGRFAYDMNSVIAAAKNYQELVYGGTQVQVVYPGYLTPRQRDAIFSDLLDPYADLLRTLRGAQWNNAAGRQAAAITGAGNPNAERSRLD